MKIQNYVVSIILAAGLTSSSAVLLVDLTFQSAFAQMDVQPDTGGPPDPYGLTSPSGFNVTGGNVTSENMTGAEEGIPTANTTGIDPCAATFTC